ncbi:hypothetical protein BGZ58_002308 [Dissophora ornata]|nr:hypothetical protein BGZ58_002308 [Dissophora ornata]
MGKSAKFFKRPTRKEKAVLSLTKGNTETSLFDSVNSSTKGNKKDILSTTAHHTISKKSSAATTSGGAPAHPPKASLAYKMQLNGGIKQAVKNMETLDDDAELESEDEEMDEDTTANGSSNRSSSGSNKKKKEGLDKSQPRPDYVELMYGKPQSGNKRKTFTPKPALIK